MKGFGGLVVGVMAALLLAASYTAWLRTKYVDEQIAFVIRDREDFVKKETRLRTMFNEIHQKLLLCKQLRLDQCQMLLGANVVVIPSEKGFAAVFPYNIREYVGNALLYIPAGTVVK